MAALFLSNIISKHACRIVLVCILALLEGAQAQEPAWTELRCTPEEQSFYRIASSVEILCDSSKKYTFEDVLLDSTNFRSLPQLHTNRLNFGFMTSAYWIRFRLRDSQMRAWSFLFLPISYTDSVECYARLPNGQWERSLSGKAIPIAQRSVFWRSAAFRLPISQETTVLVRLSGGWVFSNEPAIMTTSALDSYIQQEKFIYGLFVGLVIALSLYNFFLYIRLRDRAYGFYLLYILFFSTHALVFDSLLYYEIFPYWATRISSLSIMVLPNLAGTYLALFASELLLLKDTQLRLWRVNLILALVSAALGILALFVGAATTHPLSGILFPLSGVVGIASTLVILGAALRSAWQKETVGRYFLVATATFLVSIFIKLLANFNLITLNYGTYYGALIGFAVQLLLFSFALADRIRILQRKLAAEHEQTLLAKQERLAEHQKNEALQAANAEILAQQVKLQDQKLFIESANLELQQVNETLTEQQQLLEEQAREAESRNRELAKVHAQALQSNEEIARQRDKLSHQKSALEEKQQSLETAYHELHAANGELRRQQLLLEEQTVETELLNTELNERNSELRLLSEERNELLGIVSHDLKNSIASIQGLAEVLSATDTRISEEQYRNIVNLIGQNAYRMNKLVKNLLDVNAIEHGSLMPKLKAVDVSYLFGQTISQYQGRAAQKNIRLFFHNPESVIALADEEMTLQIADNLISNAVKYSPRGGAVHITIDRYEPPTAPSDVAPHFAMQSGIRAAEYFANTPLCVIIVKDEGMGILPEELPRLFGKFARLSTRPTGDEDSTGLGLSIVKKFAAGMNGEVWCESELGKGSAFIVTLPLA